MSRIGKLPIEIKDGAEVEIAGNLVKVNGPKGELSYKFNPVLNVIKEDGLIKVSMKEETNEARELFGLTRTLIQNLVTGVTEGFEKRLVIQGVGYKANINNENIVLNVGFSHSVVMPIPESIEAKVEKNNIIISGSDKAMVGQFAADIRAKKKPEPYKGKGIRYIDEKVRRKAGKAAKA